MKVASVSVGLESSVGESSTIRWAIASQNPPSVGSAAVPVAAMVSVPALLVVATRGDRGAQRDRHGDETQGAVSCGHRPRVALGEAGDAEQHAGGGGHERDEEGEHHDLPGLDPEAGADDEDSR